MHWEPGFDPSDVVVFNVEMPRHWTAVQVAALRERLVADLSHSPACTAVGVAAPEPLAGNTWTENIATQGYNLRPDEDLSVNLWNVSPGFFPVLRVRLLQGRLFDAHDHRAAVINQALSSRLFRHTNPISREMDLPGVGKAEIVGVVENSGFLHPLEPAPPTAFLPFAVRGRTQFPPGFLLRFAGGSGALPRTLQPLLRSIDPTLQLLTVQTLDARIDQILIRERLLSKLAGAFAAMGLFLAVVSVYGLISYRVARQANEIAIRRSLGAQNSHIVRLVVGQTLIIVLIGAVLGAFSAAITARWIQSAMFGIAGTSATTIIAVSVVLLGAALCGAAASTYRALRLDPAVNLKYE
jgi:hypothetical protein